MKPRHIEILAPAPGTVAVDSVTEECEGYADAPVCTNGNTDVQCWGEIYRGCAVGAVDCADGSGNPDDRCCAAWDPWAGGDNIDHAYCSTSDAGYGDLCIRVQVRRPVP